LMTALDQIIPFSMPFRHILKTRGRCRADA
jgi:hypothetical protein